jgi:enoyl-CoA hydratase
VHGAAVGAGLELALSADFMVVAEEARLRLPEVALGTFVGGGVVYTLADRVGVLKARELIYFGDFLSGREAVAMGMANRAVPAESVLNEARTWAHRLAERAPLSLAAAKRLIGPAGTVPRRRALREEARVLVELFGTEDWAEGVAAFRQGRPPRYRGR